MTLKLFPILLLVLGCFSGLRTLQAQHEDCRSALLICSDEDVNFIPNGRGIDDFNNPNNSEGCLQRRENFSVWFYFELREDMPLDSGLLTFEILDERQSVRQDYDFAVYGPDLNCDSLGEPVRCSFRQLTLTEDTVRTGLQFGETDTTESATTGNGFVAPLEVGPGEGFFLLVDFFVAADPGNSFDSTTVQDFTLSWGGAAAPFLNCVANPNCDLVTFNAFPDTSVCAGSSLQLESEATNTYGAESYFWEGASGTLSFLDSPNDTNTLLVIPTDFTGTLTYQAMVKEGACEHTDSVQIQVIGAPEPEITGDTILCPGDTNLLSVSGGFYVSYQWQDGSTGSVFTATQAGDYSVTVVSDLGCPGTDTIRLRESIFPTPLISGDTLLCPGETTTLTAHGGFASYEWSTGETTQSISLNNDGFYGLTVTDAENCSNEQTIEVVSLNNPVPGINGPASLCSGDTVTLLAERGFADYLWSTGELDTFARVSMQGTYSLTVTDQFGCVGSNQLSLIERPNPTPQINGDSTFCSNREALLQASPGFNNYLWSNGTTGDTLLTNIPGIYSVVVTDNFGCSGTATFETDSLALPLVNISGPDQFCAGDSIDLNASQGLSTYLWTNGSTEQTIRIGSSDLYGLTVTDPNGCENQTTFLVTENPLPQPQISGDLFFCPAASTNLQATGGYDSYLWSTQDTTQGVEIASPGLLTVTVTDGEGCLGSLSVNVQQVNAPDPEIRGDSSFCEGNSTSLSVLPVYTAYSWSDGSNGPVLSTTMGGRFAITVTDGNGCRGSDSILIEAVQAPIPIITGDSIFCEGENTVIGVVDTFSSYTWNFGPLSPQITASQTNKYVLTVTNSTGCQGVDSFEVVEIEAQRPMLMGGTRTLCQGDTLPLDAGAGFPVYRWSTGDTVQLINVSQQGNYGLTVTDGNGCRSTESVRLIFNTPRPAVIFGPREFCSGATVPLLATTGFETYRWSTGATTENIRVNSGGQYSLTVTNASGCSAVSSIDLFEKPTPEFNISGDLRICEGDTTILSVPAGFDNYRWTTEATGNAISVTEPGFYGVLVTASNGCTQVDQVSVQQRPRPLPLISGDRRFCSGDSTLLRVDGTFTSFEWSDGSTQASTWINTPQEVSVIVANEFGCPGLARTSVVRDSSPVIDLRGPSGLCVGDSTLLGVTEGFASYLWSTGDTMPQIQIQQGGLYSVSVTGANGCRTIDSQVIANLSAPAFNLVGDPFYCIGDSTSLRVEPSFNSYRWSNGDTTQRVAIQTPGPLNVEVENRQGCVRTESVQVVEAIIPLADAGVDRNIDCLQDEVILGGDNSTQGRPYLPRWVGPGITPLNQNRYFPRVQATGTYTLTVEDTIYGCRSEPAQILVRDLGYVPSAQLATPERIDCFNPQQYLSAAGSTTGPNIFYFWEYEEESTPVAITDTVALLIERGGRYRLEVVDSLTGCTNTANVIVPQDTLSPLTIISGGGQLDCRTEFLELTAPLSPPNQDWTYSWTGLSLPDSILSNNFQLEVADPDVYSLAIQNLANGCIGRDTVTVRSDRILPQANAGPSQEIDCQTPSVQLGVPVEDPLLRANWRLAEDPAVRISDAQPEVQRSGTYILELTNSLTGCSDLDSVVITQNEVFPRGINFEVQPVTCFGEQNGTIRIRSVENGLAPFVFSLNRRSFTTDTVFQNLPPDRYSLTVQDVQGCEFTELLTVNEGIELEVDLGEDQYIRQGERITLQALTNVPPETLDSVRWFKPDTLSCSDCLIQRLRPSETTVYAIAVQDNNGCSAQDEVAIFVDRDDQLYIPNVFSPNGDGFNDLFVVYASEQVREIIYLNIYSRWGAKLYERKNFQPNDPQFGWDGRLEGRYLNNQVFAYRILAELVDGTQKTFEGDVTLMR